MRCPNCGATNPESAQWCGQCLTRFGAPSPPAAPPPPAPGDPTGEAAPSDTSTSVSGNFRRRGDEIEWACPSCGEFNSIDLVTCSVCGTGFVEQFRADEVEPARNWSQALLMSAIAPGAGHLAVGRYGSGTARLLLFLTWAIGAIVLGTGGGGSAAFAIAPLALGSLAIWAASLLDVYRLSQGQAEVLVGPRLLWLVIGVLVLLGGGLFLSLASAAN